MPLAEEFLHPLVCYRLLPFELFQLSKSSFFICYFFIPHSAKKMKIWKIAENSFGWKTKSLMQCKYFVNESSNCWMYEEFFFHLFYFHLVFLQHFSSNPTCKHQKVKRLNSITANWVRFYLFRRLLRSRHDFKWNSIYSADDDIKNPNLHNLLPNLLMWLLISICCFDSVENVSFVYDKKNMSIDIWIESDFFVFAFIF